MPVPMVSHDQKYNVALCFNHLDLPNKIKLLIGLSMSCNACNSSAASYDHKKLYNTLFQLPSHDEQSGTIDDAIGITDTNAGISGIT